MKFLVVDDSALSRRMLRSVLEQLGHAVVEAADGSAGLERYVLERPDFVFLDLVMPGMSGFEALTHLRALDPEARVIICSADVQASTRDRVKKGGALAMLNKPVNVEQVSAKLNSILGGQDVWATATDQ
ncbi:MAG TPA: response regulator [Verrucomicrobiae bacterium]|nr:response regulator [Verrucomicrobiae bacterium]